MSDKDRVIVLLLIIAAIFFMSALVDPCDGHSCKGETYESR